MRRQTLKANNLRTISWVENSVVDWVNSGSQYFVDGTIGDRGGYFYSFPFDGSVTCENGIYAFIYQKLGTKGLLLKNGSILREINRSFYYANVYEYPAIFVTAKNGKTYLIHCPNDYCRIDFEDVETGEIITNHADRKPSDFFHSRFEISPDNSSFISKGWVWHPYDFIGLYDIEECIKNPLLLDESKLSPDVDAPICCASFINDHLILIASSRNDEPFNHEPSGKLKPGQIAVWDIRKDVFSKPLSLDFEVGSHLTAIDETYAWDLFQYPKIMDLNTGHVVDKMEEIFSGQQNSSIINNPENWPKIAFNRKTKQVAIANDDKIEILTR